MIRFERRREPRLVTVRLWRYLLCMCAALSASSSLGIRLAQERNWAALALWGSVFLVVLLVALVDRWLLFGVPAPQPNEQEDP